MAARTVTWPPRLEGGRWKMTADLTVPGGDRGEALRQLIRLSLPTGGPGGNPWNVQAGTWFGDATWTEASGRGGRGLRSKITTLFKRLERQRRAKLDSVDVQIPDSATILVSIGYHDLETGGRESLEVTL